MDIGSTTGTYIKIQKKIELEIGLYIELGSNLFLVQSIGRSEESSEIHLIVDEGPNINE